MTTETPSSDCKTYCRSSGNKPNRNDKLRRQDVEGKDDRSQGPYNSSLRSAALLRRGHRPHGSPPRLYQGVSRTISAL